MWPDSHVLFFFAQKHFKIGIRIETEGKRLQFRCRYFGIARECIDLWDWRGGYGRSVSIPIAVGGDSQLFQFHPAHPFSVLPGWVGDRWDPTCDLIEEGKKNGIQFLLGAAKRRAILTRCHIRVHIKYG
jgi:hypothetical protein